MMIRIALFGASGRLGNAIATLAHEETDLQISEAIAHEKSSSLGKELFGIPLLPVFQNKSDILIDVSLSLAQLQPLKAAKKFHKPIVIGVTGLTEDQIEEIRLAAKEIPIFYTANFSLGMAIFRRLTIEASKKFYQSSTADIFESHHNQKKDLPSGSALSLNRDLQSIGKTARIHSIRSGKIIGEHSLLLNSDDERLEIAHTVHSRNAFAKGALLSARFLMEKKPGLYGMDDLFV